MDDHFRSRAVWPGFSPYLEETNMIYTPYHQARESVSGGISYSGLGPKGYKRPERLILEDVCESLSQSPDVDASEIEVEVSDDVVTLKGEVPERRMKRMAEDLAYDTRGVHDVRNEISITSSSPSP